MQALVTPSQEVYTAVSCFSKMPTCTATYAQDTQASSHDQLQTKLPPVPDLENRRYCRACQIMLPVSAFPAGKRRYLCKRHIWERVQRPSKERARANVDKRRLWTIWKTCYHDAMRTFKHRRILLLQRDIQQTLAQIDAVADFVESNADVNQDVHQEAVSAKSAKSDPDVNQDVHQEAVSAELAEASPEFKPGVHQDVHQDVHQEAVSAELAEASPEFKPGVHQDVHQEAVSAKSAEFKSGVHQDVHQEAVSAESAQSNAIAFMPANPEQQLSRDNVVIVDKTARRVLLQAFREGGAQKYISELGALD